ncbi:MAG: site-specific integrase [Flammeovirgaceae bacterium]|nr:site-specific integrase [Flammeovirgaceae bacterium]
MLKIRFKLRETSPNSYHLYCTIRANKKPAKSTLSTGIRLEKSDWDKKRQIITNSDLTFENQKLQQIRTDLQDTYKFLSSKLSQYNLTGYDVKRAYSLNEKPSITLLQVYKSFFEWRLELRKRKKVKFKDITLATQKAHRDFIKKFLEEFYDTDYKLEFIDENFMDEVYDYGTQVKGNSHNHLMKIFQLLKRVVRFSKEKGWINYNPISLYPLCFDPGISDNFLFDYELDKITSHTLFSDVLIKTRDVFVAQCWSGFSYVELYNFNYEEHTFLYKGGRFITKDRSKTSVGSLLPVFPEFERILKKYNYKIPVYSNQAYNRYLKELGAIVGIDLKLTTHVARKTAGNLWLNKGIKMEVVSKMLGHKSIKTTERLYAKVHPELVFQETKHLISSPA